MFSLFYILHQSKYQIRTGSLYARVRIDGSYLLRVRMRTIIMKISFGKKPVLNKISIIKWVLVFFSERSLLEVLKMTFLLLLKHFFWTRVQNRQNGQIDIFEKTQKKKFLR